MKRAAFVLLCASACTIAAPRSGPVPYVECSPLPGDHTCAAGYVCAENGEPRPTTGGVYACAPRCSVDADCAPLATRTAAMEARCVDCGDGCAGIDISIERPRYCVLRCSSDWDCNDPTLTCQSGALRPSPALVSVCWP